VRLRKRNIVLYQIVQRIAGSLIHLITTPILMRTYLMYFWFGSNAPEKLTSS
jgi:hypothetical protein